MGKPSKGTPKDHRRELKPAREAKQAYLSSRGNGSKLVQERADLMGL